MKLVSILINKTHSYVSVGAVTTDHQFQWHPLETKQNSRSHLVKISKTMYVFSFMNSIPRNDFPKIVF